MPQHHYSSPLYVKANPEGLRDPVEMRSCVRDILKQLNSTSVQYVCNDLVDIISGSDAGNEGEAAVFISRLIFEKAIDHIQQAELYARLCRLIKDNITIEYALPTQKMGPGYLAFDDTFSQQLCKLCQEQFDQNFADVRPTWVDIGDRINPPSDNLLSGEDMDHTISMLRSKRQAFGNMKFMAELYSCNLIPQSMMASSIKVLLKDLESDNNKYKIEGLRLLLCTFTASEVGDSLISELEAGRLRKEAEELAVQKACEKEEEERKFREAEELKAKLAAEEKARNKGETRLEKERIEKEKATERKHLAREADLERLRVEQEKAAEKAGSLDLTGSKTVSVPGTPIPGPLATTRIIADIRSVQYPEGVSSQWPELNKNAREGKFSKGREQRTADDNMAPGGYYKGGHGGFQQQQQMLNLEPVEPLRATAYRWDRKAIAVDADSPEMVERKVKGLLNKLTMVKFDLISDQIIAWGNKSKKEKDGRMFAQVIRLTFESATDDLMYTEVYARLCRKMMEQISPKVQDDGIKNNEGKPIAGGQLFRKYLLNRCQEDFERGWVAKETTAATAAAKATDDEAAKVANEKTKEAGKEEEAVLYSEEYYAAQKAKRQGLGLIKFIGELFKLQMLTERIMHECVKKLLGNVDNPEEEEIESLCKLLTTVGGILDTPKARAHLDVYFSRMKELTKNPNVNSRMRYMLIDLIELRDRKWVARQNVAAPMTIAQIHENAAKEKAAAEKESYQRQMSMSRGGSRRGGDHGEHPQVGPDEWAVAGGSSGPPRPPPKAGDLSNFGNISKSGTPMNCGPNSVFAGKTRAEELAEKILEKTLSSQLAVSDGLASPPLTLRSKLTSLSPSGHPYATVSARKNLLDTTAGVPDPRLGLYEEERRARAQEDGNDDDVAAESTPGAALRLARVPTSAMHAQSISASVFEPPVAFLLDDFCRRYEVNATDRKRLARLEFQPGDEIETLPKDDWKDFAGFNTLAWRRIIAKNKAFISDSKGGLLV